MIYLNMPEICKFVKEWYKPWADAGPTLGPYLAWHADLRILGVTESEGEITAVVTCRAFDDPELYWTEFHHRPWGKYVKCSVWGAVHPRFIPEAVQQIQDRHAYRGDRIFMWHRDHIELGPPRRYSAHQFERILDKLRKL